jgi:hypothetical protein
MRGAANGLTVRAFLDAIFFVAVRLVFALTRLGFVFFPCARLGVARLFDVTFASAAYFFS